MEKAIKNRLSNSHYPVQPGDIHFEWLDSDKHGDRIYYNIMHDEWLTLRRKTKDNPEGIRIEYRGQIPFNFPQETIDRYSLNGSTYYLGRDGIWYDKDDMQVPTPLQMKLQDCLHDQVDEALKNLEEKENAYYYSPLDLTNILLRVK